jgi:hypothetical protein
VGSLHVQLTLEGDGTVSAARIVAREGNLSPSMESCVTSVLMRAHFSASPFSCRSTVVGTFNFIEAPKKSP